jgi:hypothetical protein
VCNRLSFEPRKRSKETSVGTQTHLQFSGGGSKFKEGNIKVVDEA